jgi:F420-dependent methylenetetrahydromethanopterin dehydrogenase
MSPEFVEKWEHIIQDVEKTKIPVEFIRKLVLKLTGRRQRTINIQLLLDQGMEPEDIEEVVSQKLEEWDADLVSIEFMLNIEGIAEVVQPETDSLLKGL